MHFLNPVVYFINLRMWVLHTKIGLLSARIVVFCGEHVPYVMGGVVFGVRLYSASTIFNEPYHCLIHKQAHMPVYVSLLVNYQDFQLLLMEKKKEKPEKRLSVTTYMVLICDLPTINS